MNFTALFGILVILTIVLSMIVNYKGYLYDVSKKEFEKEYENNHSIHWPRLHLDIPRFIIDKTENIEIKRKIKAYNRSSIVFWISLTITIAMYFMTK